MKNISEKIWMWNVSTRNWIKRVSLWELWDLLRAEETIIAHYIFVLFTLAIFVLKKKRIESTHRGPNPGVMVSHLVALSWSWHRRRRNKTLITRNCTRTLYNAIILNSFKTQMIALHPLRRAPGLVSQSSPKKKKVHQRALQWPSISLLLG